MKEPANWRTRVLVLEDEDRRAGPASLFLLVDDTDQNGYTQLIAKKDQEGT